MDKLIKSAFLDRKEKIPFGTDSYRVFDGQSDGIKNVYIDNFADHWLVSYNDVLPPLDLDDGPFKKSIWIKELKHEAYLCLLDIIKEASSGEQKLMKLVKTTLKTKKDRLLLRYTFACNGKELTPIQLDQYISIIEYGLEYV